MSDSLDRARNKQKNKRKVEAAAVVKKTEQIFVAKIQPSDKHTVLSFPLLFVRKVNYPEC